MGEVVSVLVGGPLSEWLQVRGCVGTSIFEGFHWQKYSGPLKVHFYSRMLP